MKAPPHLVPVLAALVLLALAPIASYSMPPAGAGSGDLCTAAGRGSAPPANPAAPMPRHADCTQAACCAGVAPQVAAPPAAAPAALRVAAAVLRVGAPARAVGTSAEVLAAHSRGPPRAG